MAHRCELTSVVPLFRLAQQDERTFRSPVQECSNYDQVYGGQLMGQFIAAAANTVGSGRDPIVLQMNFLNSARVELPIDFEVEELQTGKRMATRHVRATQAGRRVADGNVSFQVPLAGTEHFDQPAISTLDPTLFKEPHEIDGPQRAHFLANGYDDLGAHPFIEFKIHNSMDGLFPQPPSEEFTLWLRIRERLPDDELLHACAVAYMSDWWLSYAGLVPQTFPPSPRQLSVPSLNHGLWLHARCRADEWLRFVLRSPRGSGARTFALGSIFTQEGVLVASMAQQSLVTSG